MSDTTNEVAIRIDTIETAMRDDPAGYWRDESMQARYRDLIDARDNGTPPPPPSAETREIARIELTMRDDPKAYWRDQAMQDRYRALLAQREGVPDEMAPDGKSLATVNDTSHEIARLEKMMGDRRSEYWQSPALQEKYRNLIAQRDGLELETTGADRTAALQAWRETLPADVLRDWETDGSFDSGVQRLHSAVLTIAQGLEEEWPIRSFLESFDTLPTGVRSAVLRETGRPAMNFTKPATPKEMETWGQLYGGPEMIAAWGNKTRQHVGIALDRLGRMHDAMSPNERAAWLHWQGHVIAPRARQCLLFAMGSSS